MSVMPSTRADDDAILLMLRLRRRQSSSVIARRFNTTDAAIRVATDRVVRADSAEEGRDVKPEYGFLSRSASGLLRGKA